MLPGGFVNAVVRVGDTVRRQPPENAAFVRRLLEHFTSRGWTGAPRYIGVDAQGREILSFVDGHVPWQGYPPTVDGLVGVARLVRQFHDLTAGTDLAGDHEVVCHNDLSPRNTVYRGQVPIAFIDWDIAAPGRRVHDVAHTCWQYVNLGPGIADVEDASRLVRVIADAYGLGERDELVDTILWWQDRCWRGIDAAADAGVPAMARLRELGAVEGVRAAYQWTADHREPLRHALA